MAIIDVRFKPEAEQYRPSFRQHLPAAVCNALCAGTSRSFLSADNPADFELFWTPGDPLDISPYDFFIRLESSKYPERNKKGKKIGEEIEEGLKGEVPTGLHVGVWSPTVGSQGLWYTFVT